ncbi:MAG: pilus assembly protein PilM [Verrucomicrobiota bacterium]
MNTKYAVGVDIGSNTVKAVLLRKQKNAVSVIGKEMFDCRAEGIIHDHELFREIRHRLQQRKWLKYEITSNIPQYLATTQITDFPPQGNRSLEEMVSYESAQLAGMSEEDFIVDFQRMPSFNGLTNPVVMGLCKETVVREKALNITNNSLKLADLAMDGTAIAGAYFYLYHEADKENELRLLLDIGAEISTAVIVRGGSFLHTTSLFCGTNRYIQALAKEAGISKQEAEHIKTENNSATRKAAQVFEAELVSTLEQWREEGPTAASSETFKKVMVCGGGARIPAIRKYLQETTDCPTELIGIAITSGKDIEPQFLTSFGLALQGLKTSPLDISLTPDFIRKENYRRKRFVFLLAALVFFILFMTHALVRSTSTLKEEHEELNQRLEYLEKVENLAPKVTDMEEETEQVSKNIFPLLVKGWRAPLINKIIQELGAARQKVSVPEMGQQTDLQEDILTVYIGDSATFHAKKEEERSQNGKPLPLNLPSRFQENRRPDTSEEDIVTEQRMDDIARWENIVCGMLVRSDTKQRYEQIRRLIKHLQETETFANIDLMPGPEWTGREDIFRPWLRITDEGLLADYHRVHLRIPLSPAEKH